ncbi:MAG: threonine synthase [Pseudonocardiales bacterium]|nr:threonine synthase [Pseudonocardiales bacterium]
MSANDFSALSHLECSRTGATYNADTVQGTSTVGVPLLARYDLERVATTVTREEIARRAPNLWRYHELLPVRAKHNIVCLGEGMTPLLELPNYGAQLGVSDLRMKDEGLIPTGTFKARGAAVGVSRAAELGVSGIAMSTNGNAGAAWSLYAARAGLRSLITMPVHAPEIAQAECVVAGAELYLVDGLIGDASALIAAAVAEREGYQNVSTLKEPYRIEGKKTMGYEIVEQLGWRTPDVVLYPTGGGVGIIGIYKALLELRELGWLSGELPRLVAVQTTGCAPIVEAFERGAAESVAAVNAHTVASGLNVPKALGDFLVLDAVRQTGGTSIAVTDQELLAAQQQLARSEGIFVCPEGAACFAAVNTLRSAGWLRGDETVVVLNTGTGMKYPDTVTIKVPTLPRAGHIPPKPGCTFFSGKRTGEVG